VEKTYAVGGTPHRVALSRDADAVYVSNDAGLNVIDVASGTAVTLPAGACYGVAVSPDNEQIYITLPGANEIVVIDRETLQPVVGLIAPGAVHGVAFDRLGHTAIVGGASTVVIQ
jgi:DNA-binding beta-propeller fold protein YncE